jgi:hypothetical protein
VFQQIIPKGRSALAVFSTSLQFCHPILGFCIKINFNSLTAQCIPAGTKLAKHTLHKHPHHDGAVSPSSGMVLMEEHTPPPGASSQGVGRGQSQSKGFIRINKIKEKTNHSELLAARPFHPRLLHRGMLRPHIPPGHTPPRRIRVCYGSRRLLPTRGGAERNGRARHER